MGSMREWIRKYARRDNWFGFSCSVFVYLFRKGPKAAGKLIAERVWRNRERKNAFRLIQIPEEELRRQQEASVSLKGITISVVTPLYNTPLPFLREMIESVTAQTWPGWELCLADGSNEEHSEVGETCREYAAKDPRIRYEKLARNEGISANTNACIRMASGDYIALFDHDDLLLPDALFENAQAIEQTGADFLYSDEYVFISPEIRTILNTHFKPDFSPEALLTNNYICHLSVFRRSLLEKAGAFRPAYDGSQDHDLILRLTDRAEHVVHIPKPLYLWRSHSESVASDISAKTYAIDAGRRAVRDFLASKGVEAGIESVEAYPTMYHVAFPIKGDPSVRVILDQADTPRPAAETENRIRELKARSGLKNVSFTVIVDAPDHRGGDTEEIRWIVSAEPNRPKRLNAAIRASASDYIALLDPELACISDQWITEMLGLAQQAPAGAVGARILFENRRVRHAGLALGLGKQRLIGRRFFRFPEEESGYFGQIAVVQDQSAVSGECLLVSRKKYDRAGGFSEDYLNSLFDVDFCLRLGALGLRSLYCPFSAFIGGKQRRFSVDYGKERPGYAADAAVFRTVWAEALAAPDPYYNPNLSRDHADFRAISPKELRTIS